MGGLGNQLFQYGAGRSLMEKNPGSKLYWFFEDNYPLARRSYALSPFRVQAERATSKLLKKIGPERGIYRRVLRMLNMPIERAVVREKKVFEFDPEFFTTTTDSYLIGFWQSYRYLDNIRDLLTNELSLAQRSVSMNAMWARISQARCPVALHVRRSDYLKKASGFQSLPLEYYEKAINQTVSRFPEATFFVFTDDVSWVSNEFLRLIGIGQSVIVSDGVLTDAEELMLMRQCHHNIIANSSFSWWGAWLGVPEDRLVIAPEKWNGVDSGIPLIDLIPPSWVLL